MIGPPVTIQYLLHCTKCKSIEDGSSSWKMPAQTSIVRLMSENRNGVYFIVDRSGLWSDYWMNESWSDNLQYLITCWSSDRNFPNSQRSLLQNDVLRIYITRYDATHYAQVCRPIQEVLLWSKMWYYNNSHTRCYESNGRLILDKVGKHTVRMELYISRRKLTRGRRCYKTTSVLL